MLISGMYLIYYNNCEKSIALKRFMAIFPKDYNFLTGSASLNVKGVVLNLCMIDYMVTHFNEMSQEEKIFLKFYQVICIS